ncbi:MAG: hypothetical protein WBO04_08825 [Steroidobacteraceae bacterium]
MIVVDTSVWIDYSNGAPTPQAGLLQGFATDLDAKRALSLLDPLEFLEMAGRDVAIQSAATYRRLRRRGVTLRKTMDMLIGTCCLMHDHEILHNDRDFDVPSKHLGSRVLRT